MCPTVWLLGQRLNGKSRLCMATRAGRRATEWGASELNYGGLRVDQNPWDCCGPQLKWDRSPCLIQGHFRD